MEINNKISVLGEEYQIIMAKEDSDPMFEHRMGWCDTSVKKIYICDKEYEAGDKECLDEVKKKVIRHEIIHAFLYESGHDVESDWALNEEIVDYFAIQIPKLAKLFNSLQIL